MYPAVDPEKCKGCGNCAEVCPSEIYEIRENKSNPIHPEDCIECWACVSQCQTESIQLCEDRTCDTLHSHQGQPCSKEPKP